MPLPEGRVVLPKGQPSLVFVLAVLLVGRILSCNDAVLGLVWLVTFQTDMLILAIPPLAYWFSFPDLSYGELGSLTRPFLTCGCHV